jgi:glycosyltransferase involved in cell wall biosynthesis
MRILYYASSSYGGLLNYAQEQADALAGLGHEVTVLCSPAFQKRPGDRYLLCPKLTDNRAKSGKGNKVFRAARFLRVLLGNMRILKHEIIRGGFKRVLFASYAEYFAPLYAGSLRKLASKGVLFGAVVQEPVRNFVVGPAWWHRWSMASGYSFLSFAFVHDDVVLDTGRQMPHLRTVVIPYGPHQFPEATESREETRGRLRIPTDATVLFSFGHVRDNKNLDYAVRALKEIPSAHLLVAGARSASSQKPESFYVELAKSLGVAERCTWRIAYISEEEAANLFTASDLVLLTYSSSFRSASGVLHLAARYRKPCIASAGQGSLQSVVRNYRLGVWVESDNPQAVEDGIKSWMANPPQPDWIGYGLDNSWERNAKIVMEHMGLGENVKTG